MNKSIKGFFERFAAKVTKATGKPMAFILAVVIILGWALTGPIFHYSDTWQLVINTGTTIITFLMVFVIQQSQNKDTMALQIKLNELIAASGASNRLINVEDITEAELETLKKFYVKLSALAKKEADIHLTHSVDEAMEIHEMKKRMRKKKGAMLKVKLEEDKKEFQFNKDFMECMADEPAAAGFFKTLPGSHQRYFSKWIDSAKTLETKAKRIAWAVTALSKRQGYGEMLRSHKREG